jgi:hypothetical protein
LVKSQYKHMQPRLYYAFQVFMYSENAKSLDKIFDNETVGILTNFSNTLLSYCRRRDTRQEVMSRMCVHMMTLENRVDLSICVL